MVCLKAVSYIETRSLQIFHTSTPGTVAEKRFAQAMHTRGSRMSGLHSQ